MNAEVHNEPAIESDEPEISVAIAQVLVPLDGSVQAESALSHAVRMAHSISGAVTLVRVVPPPALDNWMVWSMPLMPVPWEVRAVGLEKTRSYLTGVVEMLAELGSELETEGLRVRTQVLEGDPAAVIVDYAGMDPDVSMIVMTTSGQDTLGSNPLGSVAERVFHATPVPLLLVPPMARGSARSAEEVPANYRLISVSLDGSVFAEQALLQAKIIARANQSELLLVSVLPASSEQAVHWNGDDAEVLSAWAEHARRAETEQLVSYLSRIAGDLEAEGFRVQVQLAYGRPADEILRVSQQAGADMIVMATHGRSGLQSLWMGSTTQKVVGQSLLPVLVVRAREHTPKPASS